MNKKVMVWVLAFVFIGISVSGCCNRCKKNQTSYLPAASAPAGSYDAQQTAVASESASSRQAIK